MWGHFLPGKRYSPTLSNQQIGNLRDGHEPSQPKAAEPDLWDPATSFEPTQGCQKFNPTGDTDTFGGLTKVAIYPACTTSLQRAVVLATPIPGSVDALWQATKLTYK